MDKRVPHLAFVAGWGTFFVSFSGCLVGAGGYVGSFVLSVSVGLLLIGLAHSAGRGRARAALPARVR